MTNNIVVLWLIRRAMEIGGIAGTIAVFYGSLPEPSKDTINRIFAGNWQDVTLGALVPLALYVWSQVWSFRSTTATQVVANGEQKIAAPADKPAVRQTAQRIERKPSLLKRMFGGKR